MEWTCYNKGNAEQRFPPNLGLTVLNGVKKAAMLCNRGKSWEGEREKKLVSTKIVKTISIWEQKIIFLLKESDFVLQI